MPKTTKPAAGAKRYPLNMRTTKEIRERLETAASASGRSLALEVEDRLERSFQKQDLLSEVLMLTFDRPLAGLLIALGHAISLTGPLSRTVAHVRPGGGGGIEQAQWDQDAPARETARKTGAAMLELLLTPDASKLAEHLREGKGHSEFVDELGNTTAGAILMTMRGIEGLERYTNIPWASVRELLGPLAEEMIEATKPTPKEEKES